MAKDDDNHREANGNPKSTKQRGDKEKSQDKTSVSMSGKSTLPNTSNASSSAQARKANSSAKTAKEKQPSSSTEQSLNVLASNMIKLTEEIKLMKQMPQRPPFYAQFQDEWGGLSCVGGGILRK